MLRIAICQPLVPLYRVPVFDLLGAQPGIALTVFSGGGAGSLDAAEPTDNFTTAAGPVYTLGGVGRFKLRYQQAQLDAIDPARFDLVINFWDAHYLSLWRSAKKARKLDVPLVLWGHGYSKHPDAARDFLRNAVGRRADAVLVYTRTTAATLVSTLRFPADQVFVAQNAIDQRPIQAARQHWLERPAALSAFQNQHGLDANQTIIFVSRLEADNAIPLLIHALAITRRTRPAAKLVIVGKGPELQRLQTLAHALGQQSQVIFTGSIFDEMALAPWMLSAAFMCYPENIGLSILHAYGYGLPVITGDALESHNPEIEAFLPGVTGRLYRRGDAASMAACWECLLSDASLRTRMSQAARSQVFDKYTLANMVQGFLDVTHIVDGVQRTVEFPAGAGPAPARPVELPPAPKRPRVVWVQTQPEHYFNRMIDDLNATGEIEYVPVFLAHGPGQYKDLPVPQSVPSVFLRRLPGRENAPLHMWKPLHANWRNDIYPLNYDAIIIGGYAGRTQRQMIRDGNWRDIPVYMFADSNLRSERRRGALARMAKRRAIQRFLPIFTNILPTSRLGVAYWRYYGAPLRKTLRGGPPELRNKIMQCAYYADYAMVAKAAALPRATAFAGAGLDSNNKLLFTAARLIPAKGLQLMLEAFGASGLAGSGYIWAIAGSGPLEQQLKATAGKMLNQSIFFLGFMQPSDMLALTAHAALFVLPSVYEPHGIVIQEAMAAGTPVLASNVCGAAFDLVRPGVSGWTFKSGDAADLQKKLTTALADEPRLLAMRACCQQTFSQWFARTSPLNLTQHILRHLRGRTTASAARADANAN